MNKPVVICNHLIVADARCKPMIIGLLVAVFILTLIENTHAQIVLPGTYIDDVYWQNQAISDSLNEITVHQAIQYKSIGEGLTVVNPFIQSTYNSGYVRSYNDGGVWKGKGLTKEFHPGFTYKKGRIRISFVPHIFYSENRSYRFPGLGTTKSRYSYQLRQMSGSSADIDYVQRYGSGDFIGFGLGQTDISLALRPLIIGVSTQNFTLGPARKNHLIMSNNAQGFPHVYFKSPRPYPLRIKNLNLGKLEVFTFQGVLRESDYFDDNSQNDHRYISGLSLGYELPYLPGFTVSLNKVLYKNTESFSPQDLLSPFVTLDEGIVVNSQGDTLKNTGNDLFDQLVSISLEWRIREQNARIYFELGKNDFNGTFRRGVTEFEHNRLYTFGIEKYWKLKTGIFQAGYEHTYLPFFKDYVYRPTSSAYTHTEARQGYTNKGQLLGPGIGPGSVSDFTNFMLTHGRNTYGMNLQRIRFDEDYFISQLPNVPEKSDRHDVEYSLGFQFRQQRAKCVWGVNSTLSYRYNWYFEFDRDVINVGSNVFFHYFW